jgi:hypothetical protein
MRLKKSNKILRTKLKIKIMKSRIIFMFIITFAPQLFGQSIERYVISTCGGSYSNGSSLAMDYTTGEFAITTISNVSNILTQGFHQPFFNNYASVPEVQDNNLQVILFPNPAIDHLSIAISHASKQNCRVIIYDMLGQLVKDEYSVAGIDGNFNMDIDLKTISTGNYFVRIIQNNKIITTQKIIKVNQ